MKENGITTIAWMCPFLPYINDTEENLRGLLKYCIEAKVDGIIFFGFGLTLSEGNREYFYQKLDEHFPGLQEKYQQKYGNSYEVSSPNSELLWKIFEETSQKHHIFFNRDELFEMMHTFPEKYEQLSLF